jgi:hypothetical protein
MSRSYSLLDLQQQIDTKQANITMSGIGGIITSYSGTIWFVDGTAVQGLGGGGGSLGGAVVGNSAFTTSGTSVYHALGTTNHYIVVTAAGAGYTSEEAAKIGTVWAELGTTSDTIYCTGGSDADGLPFFWMATTSGGEPPQTFYGMSADVRLERASASGIDLVGVEGSSKYIWVRDLSVPVTTTKSLITNSPEHFVISGTTSVWKADALDSYVDNDYTSYGIHYLYFCNDDACWEFSGYDRKRELIISPEAPVETGGYLAESGDGLNARHVGWVIANSSRQIDDDLCIASTFNQPVTIVKKSSSGGWQSLTLGTETDISGASERVLIPETWGVRTRAQLVVRNTSANPTNYYPHIFYDDTEKVEGYESYIGTAAGSKRYFTIHTWYEETASNDQSPLIKLSVSGTGAGSSPEYFEGSYSYISLARFPIPGQSGGFAHEFSCLECTPSGLTISDDLNVEGDITAASGTFTEGLSVGSGTVTIDNDGITLPNNEALTSLSPFYRTFNGGRLERVSDTVLEWQPYYNGSIGLYNGSNWELITPSSNPSASNDATTISGSSLAADTNYDVFGTISGTTFNLEFQEWSGGTTRYQTPVDFEGVKVFEDTEDGRKRRWLGTIRMRSDSGAKFTDSDNQRFVSNFYNKLSKPCYGTASSSPSHDYTESLREFSGGGSAVTRLEFVNCWAPTIIILQGSLFMDVNTSADFGYGINTVESISTIPYVKITSPPGLNNYALPGSYTSDNAGYFYVTALEQNRSDTGNTSNRHRWICESIMF